MSENEKFHLRDKVFWGVVALVVGVMGYILILATWPYNPLRLDSFTINKTEVIRGEEVCFKITGEKFYNVPVRVVLELVDGEDLKLSRSISVITYGSNQPKGSGFPERCFNVPSQVRNQPYKLRWTGTYEMNGFNHPRYVAHSEWLAVLDSASMMKGDKGDQGEKGDRGFPGERGGVSLFGEGKQGPRGVPGKAGKDANQ
jgi:hypothetical protein